MPSLLLCDDKRVAMINEPTLHHFHKGRQSIIVTEKASGCLLLPRRAEKTLVTKDVTLLFRT